MDSSDNPVAGWMLFLLFIVINSIFYGFGSAIQNLNENEIEDKAEQGDRKSKLLLHIMNAPGSLIQTVQFYHMLLSFLVGYVQLKSIMKTVSVSLSATAAGVFFTENPGKIILCILVLFVDLILLATFGILVPKRICSRHAAASAYRMVHMVQAGIILAWPITKLMELLTNLTVRLFGIDPNHTEDDVTEDEIIDLVDEAHEQGIIQESEAEMIQNIMEFHDKSAKDIMTHRKNINALDDTTLLKDAIVYMSEHSNSRYPVYHEDIDNIVGFIHIKDAMEHQNRAEYEAKSLMQIPKLVRSVAYIPETRGIDSLFQAMQTKKIHIAIVVDEYGGTAGVVCMEDILEEIVGNIQDEYDEEEQEVRRLTDTLYIIDGHADPEDVLPLLGETQEEMPFDTMSGFLVDLLGRIPETHENPVIEWHQIRFTALVVEENWIAKIKAELLPGKTEQKDGEKEPDNAQKG